jgi:MFS family permease
MVVGMYRAGTAKLGEPLRLPAYRALWGGSLLSNMGGMMQGVAVAWVITGLTTEPWLVAMLPAAATLPSLLVTLPAGVCADLFGRRRVLFWASVWTIGVTMVLGLVTALAWVTPVVLIVLVGLLGMGNSARIPAWQATVQDVLPRELVPQGVALNSISFNTARTVGPALGGILVGWLGPAAVMFLNGVCTSSLLVAIRQLKHPPPRVRPRWEELRASLGRGFAGLWETPGLWWTLWRAVTTNMLAACVWAFLPLIGRDRLGLNSDQFGILLSSMGVAAIGSAVLMPRLRRVFPLRLLLTLLLFLLAGGLIWLGLCGSFLSALGAVALTGGALVASNINLNVTFQQLAPTELRGRLISFYFLGFELSLGAGALAAGVVAQATSVPIVFFLAAGFLLASIPVFYRLAPAVLRKRV